ncbi:unnamed protein product [Schistosoma mattheei]|uniref:Uncharacterized protein n=1 Tax=Schistosoma mattheei TaxID=31246 RepID=A0A183P6R6_9TREM|nr:unnamed protein product [Schistosoma mattheei]
MPERRLPRRAMLTGVGDGWNRVRGGQTKTCHQSTKSLTSSLSHELAVSYTLDRIKEFDDFPLRGFPGLLVLNNTSL